MCECVRRERERNSTIFATGTKNERIETMTCAICEHYFDCEMAKLRLQFCGYVMSVLIPKKNEDDRTRV